MPINDIQFKRNWRKDKAGFRYYSGNTITIANPGTGKIVEKLSGELISHESMHHTLEKHHPLSTSYQFDNIMYGGNTHKPLRGRDSKDIKEHWYNR